MTFSYILLGVSLFFIAIGFIVTERNAKYILSGYNTMSKAEQDNVNIKSGIRYFKKFHIFLGISLFVIGTILNYFKSDWAGIFIVVYPILAYIYLTITSAKYNQNNSKSTKFSILVLIGILIFIVFLLFDSYRKDTLTFDVNKIEISGEYGETIDVNQIKNIELVDKIPEISYKMNGSSLGTMSKGHFKTKNGEKVKLILNNSDNVPYIFILKKNGEKIYYSSKNDSDSILFNQIKNHVDYN